MPNRLLTLLFVAASMAFGACTTPEGTEFPAPATAAQALGDFEATLDRDGSVAHAVLKFTYSSAEGPGRLGSIEAWYDADRQLGRQEWIKDPSVAADVPEWQNGIITAEGIYLDTGSSTRTISPLDREPAGRLEACGAPSATILLTITSPFGCFVDWTVLSSASISTTYNGRPAIELLGAAGPEIAPPERTDTRAALYLDASTYLPIAVEITVDGLDASIQDSTLLITYAVDFVAVDTLPPTFFDLAEVSYLEPTDFFDRVEEDLPIYWLGPEITLEDGATLVLEDVTGDEGPGWSARLWYRSADTPPVYVNIFRPAEWTAFLPTELGQSWWTADCVETESVAGRNRSGTIYSGYQNGVCRADAPFDGFMAVVEFEDAVVTINTPNCFTCGPGDTAPDILRQVIADMGRRAPDR